MNYVAINGLRILVVESCVLVTTFALALSCFHLSKRQLPQPHWLEWLLQRNLRAVVVVVFVALVGRAALLPIVGIPAPRIDDEYSNLLMADTFSHFRLANPTPAAWPNFETFHVNMVPTYHSKYPVSQGLFLALGQIVFHQPWAGVYLSTGLLCGAICWTLQSFVPPAWALVGSLLATFRIAFLSYWVNSYWGGSIAALAGALALGAVVRLFRQEGSRRRRIVLSALFAVSMLMLATSRPYEGFAFALPLLAYFCYHIFRPARERKFNLGVVVLPVVVIELAGIGLMGFYNRRTTGDAFLLPHLLNERTYSPLPLFLFQQTKRDFRFRDPAFAKFFRVTEAEYGYQENRTASSVAALEAKRVMSDWFFYVGPALSFPVLIGVLASLQQRKLWIVAGVASSTALALGLCIYTMPHYAAPATITIYIFAVEGLRQLWDLKGNVVRAFVVAVCFTTVIVSLARQTGATALNAKFVFPDTRRLVIQQLATLPGKHLVLVSYEVEHHYPGNELVHNGADFNSEKVLWGRSKGVGIDSDLCRAYSDRSFWSLTTDDERASLIPFAMCK